MAATAAASVGFLLHRHRTVVCHSAAAIDKSNNGGLAPLTGSAAAKSLGIRTARLPNPSLFFPPTCIFHHLSRRCRSGHCGAAEDAYYDEDDDEDEDIYENGGEGEGGGSGRRKTPSRTSVVRGEEAGRLYVGNLPYSMTPSQLADVFSQAGTVDAVEVVYDRVTDRSRGFAFVTMGSADEASEAIRMFHGAQVGGRTVRVNFPEVPRGREREVIVGPRIRRDGLGPAAAGFVDSPHKLYAGNLGWAVTSESLKDAFGGRRGLLGARVIYDRDSGRSRGYGFVSFASPEDALSALEAMDGLQEVEGRPLRLNLAAERSVSSSSRDDDPQKTTTEEMDNTPSLRY